MKLLSGDFSMRLELSLASLLSRAVAAVESDENGHSPQSPDCSIEDDDSEVEGPPFKKTSIKVRLDGQMIQVVETRIRINQGDAPINATVIQMETI